MLYSKQKAICHAFVSRNVVI